MNHVQQPQWKKPLLDEKENEDGTWEDGERGELKRTANDLRIAFKSLIRAFKGAKLQPLSDEEWSKMKNCDSRVACTIEEFRERLRGVRKFKIIEEGLTEGHTLPAPVVLYRKGHDPYLVAGNSRLLGCRALGKRPMVWAVWL